MSKGINNIIRFWKQGVFGAKGSYVAAVSVSLITLFAIVSQASGQERVPYRFDLVAANDTIANCLPHARATVAVFPKEEINGVDTFDLRAKGLLPDTAITVFLTELPNPPFGAAEYIGDFTTNSAGEGSLRVNTVIEEAFSSVPVGGLRVRGELNHVVLWFADPTADDVCFAPGTGPVTPFDADGSAGATVLSSKNFLPGTPIP